MGAIDLLPVPSQHRTVLFAQRRARQEIFSCPNDHAHSPPHLPDAGAPLPRSLYGYTPTIAPTGTLGPRASGYIQPGICWYSGCQVDGELLHFAQEDRLPGRHNHTVRCLCHFVVPRTGSRPFPRLDQDNDLVCLISCLVLATWITRIDPNLNSNFMLQPSITVVLSGVVAM